MAIKKFTAADIMPLFTEKSPLISVMYIAKKMNCSVKSASNHLRSIEKAGAVKKHKVEGCVLFSKKDFQGCIEDYVTAGKPDSECAPYVWNKNIVKERERIGCLAKSFHKILGNNNMEVFA